MAKTIKTALGGDVIAVLLYAFLTLLMTYPLISQFSTHVIGGYDVYQNLWNLWWVEKAILSGQTPYYTDQIMHPAGANLAFHTLSLFNSLLAIPLQVFWGMTETYNILCFLTFPLSAYGMFLLARYLTGDWRASFIAGLIFAFCPYRLAHLFTGHLNLVSTHFIPFYVLYLIKTTRETGSKNPLLAGFFLFLTSICSWHYMMHSIVFTTVFLLYETWFNKSLNRDILKRFITLALVFSILILPFAYPLIVELSKGGYDSPLLEFAVTFSADTLAFATPSLFHPVFGSYTTNIYNAFTGNISENTVFVGYSVLLLAAFYVIKKDPVGDLIKEKRASASKIFATRRNYAKLLFILLFLALVYTLVFKLSILHSILIFSYSVLFLGAYYILKEKKIGFWALSAIFFYVLSLGPLVKICGTVYAFPLPGILFPFIPGLSFLRDPARFGLLMLFCLSIMAAFSLKMILERKQRKNTITIIVSAVILFEFLTVPNTMTPMDTSPFYDWLAEQPGDFAIVDFPIPSFYNRHADYMYYQTKHGKKIGGGYISIQSGSSREFYKNTPVLQMFEDPVTLLKTGEGRTWLITNAYLKPPERYYEVLRASLNRSREIAFVGNWVLYDTYGTPLESCETIFNQTYPEGDIIQQDIKNIGVQVLNEYNIRYVIVHKKGLEFMRDEEVDIILEEVFPRKEPIYSDDDIDVYEVPETEKGFFAALGVNWFLKEPFEPVAMRWMSNDATIELINAEEGPMDLTFEAKSFEVPRTLSIYLDNEPLGEYPVGGEYSEIKIENITLKKGKNRLLFHTPEGCTEQVYEYSGSNIKRDRCVSLAFQNVTFSFLKR